MRKLFASSLSLALFTILAGCASSGGYSSGWQPRSVGESTVAPSQVVSICAADVCGPGQTAQR
jgi:hypothetical protein